MKLPPMRKFLVPPRQPLVKTRKRRLLLEQLEDRLTPALADPLWASVRPVNTFTDFSGTSAYSAAEAPALGQSFQADLYENWDPSSPTTAGQTDIVTFQTASDVEFLYFRFVLRSGVTGTLGTVYHVEVDADFDDVGGDVRADYYVEFTPTSSNVGDWDHANLINEKVYQDANNSVGGTNLTGPDSGDASGYEQTFNYGANDIFGRIVDGAVEIAVRRSMFGQSETSNVRSRGWTKQDGPLGESKLFFHDRNTASDLANNRVDNTHTADTSTWLLAVPMTPPVAVNDTATVAEDGSVNVDVLANDSDADNQPPSNAGLTVTAVTQGANGSVTFTATGVTYTPSANFFGNDSFTYTITDPTGLTASATVSVTVTAVADAPVAVNDSATVAEDGSVNIDVLANDFDVDNQPAGNTGLTVTAVSQGSNGSVTFTASGVTYTPNANFFGSDSVTYTVTDTTGLTSTATVSVTVTALVDAPTAGNDAATVAEDGSVNIDVLANDFDVDNQPPDNGGLTVTAVTQGSSGTVTFTATDVTYTPNANFFGNDSFTYTIADPTGLTSTATVSMTVSGLADAPVALNDTATVAEDGSVNIDVLANDFDVDNQPASNTGLTVTAVTQGANGSVTFTASGVTYTPDADFFGSDSFTYTITDTTGLTSTATVSVTVTGENNDAPVAVDDSAIVLEDGSLNIDVLANDFDVDNQPQSNVGLEVTAVTQGGNGTVTFTASGVTYTPDADFSGSDSFTYTIADPTGLTSTATVSVTVTGENNDAPVAVDDTATVLEDGSVNIDVLANDFDVDNQPASNAGLTVTAVTQGSNGTVTFTASGVTYTPNANFFGSDSFTYTITDTTGLTSTATVNVTITGENNDAPVAVDDSAIVLEDGSLNIDVLANDFDMDNQPQSNVGLEVTAVTQGANGSVAFTASGVTYTPNANFFGSDSFTYTITDTTGLTSTATVNVTVTGENNDAPVAVDDTATVLEDGSVNIDVLANDFDVDNQPQSNVGLEVTPVTQGANGTVTFTASGVTYTPDGDFFGSDSFSYTITDATGLTSTATVSVTVTGENNDAPVGVDDSATVLEDGSVNIDVLANDFDVDNQPQSNAGLEVTAATQGANGSVTFTAAGVTYTPDADFSGSDSFTYTIADPTGLTSTATVSVTVTGENNDAPVAVDDTATVLEDGSVNIDVLANDFDVDNQPQSNVGLEVTAVTQGANGTVTFTASGVTYTPDADFFGSDSFTYTITDATGLTSTATVSVTVTAEDDDAPVAVDDSATVAEDSSINVDVLANDFDVDNQPASNAGLTVTAVTQGASGTVTFTATGVTYTPHASFFGGDSFTYTITDSTGLTSTATVSVTVKPLHVSPPTLEGGGAITNDSTPTLVGTAAPAGSTVTIYDDGALVGTTTVDGDGAWSFTFTTPLADGSHPLTATVTDGDSDTSAPSDALVLTVDTQAPVAPEDLALSTGGNLTGDNTPTIVGTAEPGSTVTVYDDGIEIGSGVADGTGAWSITVSLLSDGVHNLTATATDEAGNISPPSEILVITIDTQAPAAVTDLTVTPTHLVLGDNHVLTGDNTPTFTGTAEPGATVSVYDDAGNTLLGTVVADADTGAFSFTLPGASAFTDGEHNITVVVTDAAGNSSAASEVLIVTVDTASPVVTGPVAAQVASEGSSAAIELGSFTDSGPDAPWSVVVTWGDGTNSTSFTLQTPGSLGTQPHTYADNGTYVVTVRVTDAAGNAAGPISFDVTVANVAPTATVTGPDGGVRGQPRTFNFDAADVSLPDDAAGFSYSINWGDGTEQTLDSLTGIELNHVFTHTGVYTVQVTATDKDGGVSEVASHAISITVFALQPNANNPAVVDLVVGGTLGKDTLTFTRRRARNPIKAVLNGKRLGGFRNIVSIIAYGQAGDDVIVLKARLRLPARLHGDGGNDQLTGARGSDWLIGGPGNDRLMGNRGHDVLIGGEGRDRLLGGGGRDLLIGGVGADRLTAAGAADLLISAATAFDANREALAAVLAEWTSPKSYEQRVANLTGAGDDSRLNGDVFLKSSSGDATISDDGAVDALTAGGGVDWFFAKLGRDRLRDKTSLETVQGL